MTPPRAVAIDAMGGDNAPGEVVAGALLAVRELGIPIVLVGDEQQIVPLLKGVESATRDQIKLHHTTEVIGMGDHPVEAIRKHKKSSLAESIRLVKTDPTVGSAMSAGNSGAFMAGGKLILGGIPGIDRPGFTIQLPSAKGTIVLLDAGAAMDCSSETLLQFAQMGDLYARLLLKRPRPTVALLNVGSEEGKGDQRTKETWEFLKASSLNFMGNIEGDRVFEGDADVVVCDGFAGNVLLKTAEGVVHRLTLDLKEELMANLVRKVGALLAQDAFRGLKRRYDWEEMAGGVSLGVRGNLVVTHGKSKARSIMNSIRLAHLTAESRLAETLAEELSKSRTAAAPVQEDA
ncbi:MAG: phosphate acyltransferase PlsX [bacterium]